MKLTKLILSIASVCFSIAIMFFGVLAATQVSYSVTGRVSYTVSEAYVEITTKVYKYGDYTSNQSTVGVDAPTTSVMLAGLDIFSDTTLEDMPSELASHMAYSAFDDVERYFNTYTNENDQGTTQADITDDDSGIYQYGAEVDGQKTLLSSVPVSLNTTTHKAVFIVVEVKNISDAELTLSVGDITYPNNATALSLNILDYKNLSSSETIAPHNSANDADKVRVVIGFAIADVTQEIDSIDFSYSIEIANLGE